MNQVKLTQVQILDCMTQKFIALGGKEKTRTINPMDPTEVTTGVAIIGLEYGFTNGEMDEEAGDLGTFPQPENVEVRWACSWGTEINLYCSDGEFAAYFDPHDKKWYARGTDLDETLRRLERLFIEGMGPINLEEDE